MIRFVFDNRGWIVFWSITLFLISGWFWIPLELYMLMTFIYGHQIAAKGVI